MALTGELQPWEGVGRWAEASRMPTAGDLHWVGRVRDLVARVTQPDCPVGHPEAALPPRGQSPGLALEWTKASPPGTTTSEGHGLQENMASRGYHLQGLSGWCHKHRPHSAF